MAFQAPNGRFIAYAPVTGLSGEEFNTNPALILVQPMEIECLHNAHIHYSAAGQGLYDTYEGGESFHRNYCRERK